MTTTKEQLDHLATLIQDAKLKLAEAANYAAEHNLDYVLNLSGSEHYLSCLDDALDLKGFDLEDEDHKKYYNRYKQELLDNFGVSEGYVWATSSSFC